jgi:hypothetical protein
VTTGPVACLLFRASVIVKSKQRSALLLLSCSSSVLRCVWLACRNATLVWRSLPALAHMVLGFEVFLQAARAYQRRIGSPSIHGLGPCFRVSPHVTARSHSTGDRAVLAGAFHARSLEVGLAPLQRLASIAEPRALVPAASPKGCDRDSKRQPTRVLLAEVPSSALPSLPDSGFGAPPGFLNLSTLLSQHCRSGLVSCRFRSWGSLSFRGFPSGVADESSSLDGGSPLGVVCPSWRLPDQRLPQRLALLPTGVGCLQGSERTRSPFRPGARF